MRIDNQSVVNLHNLLMVNSFLALETSSRSRCHALVILHNSRTRMLSEFNFCSDDHHSGPCASWYDERISWIYSLLLLCYSETSLMVSVHFLSSSLSTKVQGITQWNEAIKKTLVQWDDRSGSSETRMSLTCLQQATLELEMELCGASSTFDLKSKQENAFFRTALGSRSALSGDYGHTYWQSVALTPVLSCGQQSTQGASLWSLVSTYRCRTHWSWQQIWWTMGQRGKL